ncbi:hypothetical protein ACJIZ3_022705 [Penstemon smallii]|uniref:DUF7653 domain-containing protein n=1 Tax=Penstemon smallii TaxID=265156 RepID=A0ABD3TM31_9LAMI
MKKLFFFRSQQSNSGYNDRVSPPSTDKQVSWEKPMEKVDKSTKSPCLRRSLSFSSGSLYDTGKGLRNHTDQNGSPCSTSHYSHKQSGCQTSRSRPLTPERHTRTKSDLSENSSYCSSNVSSKVLDRFIDGEQQMETNEKNFSSMRNQAENVVKWPPRFQSTRHVSSHDARKQKPKSQSFRENKVSQNQVLFLDDNGFSNESPRKLAKNVVERLSQSQFLPKIRSNNDAPITIDDVYSRSRHEETLQWNESSSYEKEDRVGAIDDSLSGIDLELFRKFKEAEDRAALFSEELEQEKFLQVRGISIPLLIQTIRSLTEEKANMAMEVSSVLQDRIADKALFRELDAQTRRLEKEKNELQLVLEKELDRRSNEWSFKHEKYKSEEHRLRERVRELAEQNVSLQKEVSSLKEKELDTRTKITMSDKQLDEFSIQLEEAKEENHYMQKKISELQDKSRAAEEDRDCFNRNYEEKVNECKDMHQSITRLQRSCIDQEKTIDGLRELCEELGNQENLDSGFKKLQVELMRLTGVEHTLRKEVESYRVKVDSLRHENIELFNRLKSNGEGTFSKFKLDRELQNRISSLQNQVLPLLINSSKLGRKLLDYVKTNTGCSTRNGQVSDTGISRVLVECEVKLQGLERAAQNLTSSTKTISSVLQDKSSRDSPTPGLCDESHKQNDQKPEDIIRSELKAEALLTSLLREKLYSNELEIEQLQAELAASVRCNDILKCELQNAMDNFSCANHKMKDLELQMMKKDEIMNRVEGELQECKKELAVVRGILPKVTEERDLMWEDVKQCSEKNMLLDSHINILKKKIEALDEDILLKDGQIAILKDSIGKQFDLLTSPVDSIENF